MSNNHELSIYLDAQGNVCLTYWDWRHGKDIFFELREDGVYEVRYDDRIEDMAERKINLRDELKDLIQQLDTEASR